MSSAEENAEGLWGFVTDAWEQATDVGPDGDVQVSTPDHDSNSISNGDTGGGVSSFVQQAWEEAQQQVNESNAAAVPDPLHVESLGSGAFRLSFPSGVHLSQVESWLFSSGTAPDSVSLEEEAAKTNRTSFGAYGVSLSGMIQQLRTEAYAALVSAWPESYEDQQQQNEKDDQFEQEARAAYEQWAAMPNADFGVTNGEVMSDPQYMGAHEVNGKFIWIGYTARGKAMQTMDVPPDEWTAATIRWFLFEEGEGKSLRDAERANKEDWNIRIMTAAFGML